VPGRMNAGGESKERKKTRESGSQSRSGAPKDGSTGREGGASSKRGDLSGPKGGEGSGIPHPQRVLGWRADVERGVRGIRRG